MFYGNLVKKGCPSDILMFQEKNAVMGILSSAIKAAIDALVEGSDKVQALKAASDVLYDGYTLDMFDFAWQYENAVGFSVAKINRLINFMLADETEIVSGRVDTFCPSKEYGVIEGKVDLILKRKNVYYAVIVNLGNGKRSSKGKSIETKSMYEPGAVVAKYSLEKRYPNIVIWNIYLNSSCDSEEAVYPELDVSDVATGQLKALSYSSYYKNGVFDTEQFLAEVAEVAFMNPGKSDCDFCRGSHLCSERRLLEPSFTVLDSTKKKVYTLPKFSEEQERITHKDKGVFMVIAGPGSGKTATLVGRIEYLTMHKKVNPAYILAITFTRKAAEEIKERCSFLDEGNMPTVSTIHSLAYSILSANVRELGLEQSKLLTKEIQTSIILALLGDECRGLEGFKFGKKGGKTGYLSTIISRIDDYHRGGEAVIEEKGLGQQFISFVKKYDDTVRAGGYISYDEQISKCVMLLKENAELLSAYQHTFKYVCVDEFQDINKEQWAFIRLLSGEDNLMVIGDDDQAIFGFQGGSVEFMMNFKDSFPNGEVYYLTKNYRSSQNVVKFAAANLTNDLVRFDKEIVGVRGSGAEVNVITGSPQSAVDIVKRLLCEGERPDDIAVLASKNATLDFALGQNDVPFAIEGERLAESAFFTFLRTALALIENPNLSFERLEYFTLFGVSCPLDGGTFIKNYMVAPEGDAFVVIGDEKSPYACLKKLSGLKNASFETFCREAAIVAGYLNQRVYTQLLEEMKKRGVRTAEEFRLMSKGMFYNDDSAQLERDYPGRVVCTTVHKAKGREWKHVIVLDDFGTKGSDDTRRMIYVALTRAVDGLYIVKKPNAASLIVSA